MNINVNQETMKFPEENIRKNIHDIGISKTAFSVTHKSLTINGNTHILNYFKIGKSPISKGIIKRQKTNDRVKEVIWKMCENWHISRISRNQLVNEK